MSHLELFLDIREFSVINDSLLFLWLVEGVSLDALSKVLRARVVARARSADLLLRSKAIGPASTLAHHSGRRARLSGPHCFVNIVLAGTCGFYDPLRFTTSLIESHILEALSELFVLFVLTWP